MKLDKAIVQRRLDLMAAEGVVRIVTPNRVGCHPHNLYRHSCLTHTLAKIWTQTNSRQRTMLLLSVPVQPGLAICGSPTDRQTVFTLRWNTFR